MIMTSVLAIVNAFLAADALPLETQTLARPPSTVSTLDERDPAYLFRLTNPGKTSYVVSRVEASCGCLATTLSPGDGKSTATVAPLILPVSLAPGQSLTVRATVRLSDLRSGPFHKTVTIWGRSAATPTPRNTNDAVALSQAEVLARVVMEGTLAQPVLFARESAAAQPVPLSGAPVALGRVPAQDGGGAIRQAANRQPVPGEFVLRVTPDPSLLAAGGADEMPPLTSSHPALAVMPLPDAGHAREGELRTLRYRVRVAPGAPLGPFLASLSFTPQVKGTRTGDELRRDRAWRAASLASSSTFNARTSPVSGSESDHTEAMPPDPSSRPTTHRPIRAPDARADV